MCRGGVTSRVSKIPTGVAVFLLVGAAALYGSLLWYGEQVRDPRFFEPDVAAFEAETLETDNPVLFVGSSSIRLWSSLADDMAPLPVLNRGFGGSQRFHLVYFAERILGSLSPTAVVVYAGDNDLDESTGKTADDVLTDYQAFVAIVHRIRPDTPLYYLAIKPSLMRWGRWPEMSRANRLIEEWSEGNSRLSYIDTTPALLGPEGTPRSDVFLFDGLHLNEVGYAGWTAIVRARLIGDLAGGPGLAP
jgi:hypothetical protein